MKHHWQYLLYLLQHKWYVYRHCARLNIRWRGITHDLSKFRPSEWNAVVAYRRASEFGSRRIDIRAQSPFDLALHRHYRRNDHHWQYWVGIDHGRPVARKMPVEALRELVADWWAMEDAGQEVAFRYWVVNRDSMYLHPVTFRRIEAMLRDRE